MNLNLNHLSQTQKKPLILNLCETTWATNQNPLTFDWTPGCLIKNPYVMVYEKNPHIYLGCIILYILYIYIYTLNNEGETPFCMAHLAMESQTLPGCRKLAANPITAKPFQKTKERGRCHWLKHKPRKSRPTLVALTKSKKSPTGPTKQTPKPEYLIALATYLGVRW